MPPRHKRQDRTVAGVYRLVAPSDSTDLPDFADHGHAIALYIGTTAGNVVFTQADNTDVTVPVTAFQTLPCTASRVKLTGTTATTIHAIY